MFHAADIKGRHQFNDRDVDLAIAASCNHTIYDYGTFGFWGAYLAGGHTILAHHMGPVENFGVAKVKPADIPNWEFMEAFNISKTLHYPGVFNKFFK